MVMRPKIPTDNIILTDIDGVLLDLLGQMSVFLKQEKGVIVTNEDWLKGSWLHEIIGGDIESDRALFVEFTHSHYFKTIPAIPNTIKALKTLHETGWRFIAITATGQDCPTQDLDLVKQNRLENLKIHFGDIFEDIHIISVIGSKKDILEQYAPTWWLEDSLKHANDGLSAGHKPILMSTPFLKIDQNKNNIPVIHCPLELVKIISKETKKPHNRKKWDRSNKPRL